MQLKDSKTWSRDVRRRANHQRAPVICRHTVMCQFDGPTLTATLLLLCHVLSQHCLRASAPAPGQCISHSIHCISNSSQL